MSDLPVYDHYSVEAIWPGKPGKKLWARFGMDEGPEAIDSAHRARDAGAERTFLYRVRRELVSEVK